MNEKGNLRESPGGTSWILIGNNCRKAGFKSPNTVLFALTKLNATDQVDVYSLDLLKKSVKQEQGSDLNKVGQLPHESEKWCLSISEDGELIIDPKK